MTRHRRAVFEYLRSLIPGDSPPLLQRMLRYHLGWEDTDGKPSDQTGKGLRPALCLLSCEAAGGSAEAAIPAAAAVELVHSFSLVHDDIQDADVMRHGRPTVWKRWGEAQAINAGDALLALARLAVIRLPESGVSAEITLEAARILDERTLEMVAGQTMDLEFENRVEIEVPDYLSMVEKKSGALFDCAMSVGALVAGGEPSLAARLGHSGRLLGTAFQVRDDMLGVWGAENRTGKQPAADVRRRKKSLPVVYALSQHEVPLSDDLRRVYAQPELSHENVSFVLRSLDEVGAREYCARLATERAEAALAVLDGARLRWDAADELRQAATFLLERDF